MTYLDSAVLSSFERLCRSVQLLTGWTNVRLAFHLTNLSIIVYFVWAGLYLWKSDSALRIVLALFFGLLLYVLSQTIFKVSVDAQESSAYRRVANGFRNPRRQRDLPLRVPFLTLSFLLSYPIYVVHQYLHLHLAVLGYFLVVLTTVVLYLLACDPLPPCAGKVRDWLRGFALSRVTDSKAVPSVAAPKPLRSPRGGRFSAALWTEALRTN